MKDEPTDPAATASGGIPNNELFDVLSHPTRRTVLFHLRQQRVATLEELIDVIAEFGSYGSSETDRERIRASLHHTHFPKLEESEYLTFDADAEVTESTDRLSEIAEWVDLAVHTQIQLERKLEIHARSDEQEGIRVLLVDDEPGVSETAQSYIEAAYDHMEVVTAGSALEAVSLLGESSFDCIVSDYQMPGISGLDFLKAVREEDSDIPFIVFTAKGSETIASQALATGVTDYVQKGMSTNQYEELVTRIDNAVCQG